MMQFLPFHSTVAPFLASLCCLVVTIDGRLDDGQYGLNDGQYGLIMERMPSLYQEWALTKRDVCADAIPGTITSTCTPGSTLCCTPNNTNVAFPQCQTILNEGYCCVTEDNCYIDTPSDCAASNSVQCTLLASGVSEACCPPFTTCPGNFNQSSTVRCNLVQSSSVSSSSTTSTTSSSRTKTSSSSAATTSSSTISTDTLSPVSTTSSSASSTGTGLTVTSSSSSSLSPGADAGIGVGVALAVLAIAALAFWAYRRGKKKGAAARAAEAQALGSEMTPHEHQQYYDPTKYSDTPQYQQGYGQPGQYNQHELPAERTYQGPSELAGGPGQHELP